MIGNVRRERSGTPRPALAFVAGACLLACASPPREPAQAIAQAERAVERADLGEAAEAAPLELRIAREKLEDARDKLRDEEYTDARRLAEEAVVDAELAETRAAAANARASARDLREGVESIRNQAEQAADPATPSGGTP